MKFGIFVAPFHAMNENPTQAFRRDMLLMEHVDQLGYDEAWIGEHHSGGFETIASPEIFIAAAAERTRDIRLGTGVVSLPYHHPLIVADRIVQIDHMSRGRVMLGVGPGALVGDAYRMGIDPANQRRMMNESLDAIVRLLDGEIVSMKTDWFELRDAQLQLPCYQHPRTEIAVASTASPSGALAAGKHGVGLLSIGGTSDEALVAHARNWTMCEEAAAEHGKTVNRENWRLVTLMHVAESREKARRDVAFGLEAWAQYFRDIATFPIVPHDIEDAYEYLVESKMGLIGTPDDAIAFIETLLEGAGGFGTLTQLSHNWADWEATKRNYELIARYVFPHFQNTNRRRVASYEFSRANHELFVREGSAAIQQEIDRHAERQMTADEGAA